MFRFKKKNFLNTDPWSFGSFDSLHLPKIFFLGKDGWHWRADRFSRTPEKTHYLRENTTRDRSGSSSISARSKANLATGGDSSGLLVRREYQTTAVGESPEQRLRGERWWSNLLESGWWLAPQPHKRVWKLSAINTRCLPDTKCSTVLSDLNLALCSNLTTLTGHGQALSFQSLVVEILQKTILGPFESFSQKKNK